jgi:hypothetical protein
MVRLDVLAVYLLQGLHEAGMLTHMCFKGGNSLRKIFARRPSRFSRDMDFVDASYRQLPDTGISAEEYYYTLLEVFDQRTMYDGPGFANARSSCANAYISINPARFGARSWLKNHSQFPGTLPIRTATSFRRDDPAV